MSIKVLSFSGAAAATYLPDLARLRIGVFREYPYLYEGDMAYEEKYLETYLESPRSCIVIAFEGEQVIGASTAVPLEHETQNVIAPFAERNIPLGTVFYFGESVLSREYRGRGIGLEFFRHREAAARSFGTYRFAYFCAVIRPADHPRRPEGYVPLDAFWRKRGFEAVEGMTCEMSWPDLDEPAESPKKLLFWKKELR